MDFETHLRQLVAEEISKQQPSDLVPLEEFCEQKSISRITVWRAEKRGELKLTRIGKRVFVNTRQFDFSPQI